MSENNDSNSSNDFNEIENFSAIESDAVFLNDADTEENFLPSSQADKDTFTRFYQTYEKPLMPFSAIQQQVVNKSGSVEAVKAISGSVFDRHYAPLVGPLKKVTEVIKGNCVATKKELRRVSKELANTPQFLNDHVEKKPFTPGDWLMLVILAVALLILLVSSPLTMKAHFESTHLPLFKNHPYITYGLGLTIVICAMVIESIAFICISNRFKKITMGCFALLCILSFGDLILGLGSMTRLNGLSGAAKTKIVANQSESAAMQAGDFTQKWMLFEITASALSLSGLIYMLNKRYHSGKIKNPHYGSVKKDLDKLHTDLHDRSNMLGSAEGRLEMIQHERELFIADAVTTYHYALQERA